MYKYDVIKYVVTCFRTLIKSGQIKEYNDEEIIAEGEIKHTEG